MSDVTSWSLTAASNNSSPPDGWPEAQAPSTINNCAREMMRAIAKEAQINAVKVLGSVAGTDTITGSMSPGLTAYSGGMLVIFEPAATNTGPATLAIDGLAARSIVKGNNSALAAGDIINGAYAVLVYDASSGVFLLLNPQGLHQIVGGTYTPTVLGITNVSSVGTVDTHIYTRIGGVVTVFGAVSVTLTSGGATLTTVSVSIPVSSDFSAAANATGTLAGNTSGHAGGYIYADASTNTVRPEFFSTTSGIQKIYYSFTYAII
jgi:hypothetical protein